VWVWHRHKVAILRGVSDLTVLEVVPNEAEAELIRGLLRDAGIVSMQRMTNMGTGAADGLPVGGPREILVREEQLASAREVIGRQGRGR
jgi:hypothetical protein